MKISQVSKMTPLERFLYWIEERHRVYLRKEAGDKKPWTDDEVLRDYFFTNPYRENDKVTKWFAKNIRKKFTADPLCGFATVCFRWFNLPETGQILIDNDLLRKWNRGRAIKILDRERRAKGLPVFTGAFMINSPPGEPKLEAICRRVNNVWVKRRELAEVLHEAKTLEEAHRYLTTFDGLGGFMAYEVVCDLRFTQCLRGAKDVLTWCNPGPGCIRGLYRIAEEEFPKGNNSTSPPRPKDWRERMSGLLIEAQTKLAHLPAFEMREIEHSLCEWDKYERARLGDGRMKRTYNGS